MAGEGAGALDRLRHDLRTPLNAVIGYSQMLLEDALLEKDEGIARELKKVHAAGELLVWVVNERLLPARAVSDDPGSLVGIVREELHDPVEAILGAAEYLLGSARAKERAEYKQDLHRILSAAKQFHRLAYSLCGPGQLGASQSPLETEEMSGLLTLPVASLGGTAPAEAAPAGELGCLLVVDDAPLNRDLLSRRLVRIGHEVVTASTGLEALERLAQGGIDLVLLDLMMPDLDGFQVLERIKADPATRDVPVLMLSAQNAMEAMVRCLQAGADDYLPKPFDPGLLRLRIGKALARRGATRR